MSGLFLLLAVSLVYAMVTARLNAVSVGAPLVFMVTGAVLGPGMADLLPVVPDSHLVKILTEVALSLLLFADASTVEVRLLRRDVELPSRLLGIGLPLTILIGLLLAHELLGSLTWVFAALVATILAPTDAALSLPVVSNPAVPRRIRRLLNVESGLNDGLATPIIAVLLVVVVDEQAGSSHWLVNAARSLAVAVAVAAVVGVLVGALLRRAAAAGWTTKLSEQVAMVSMALVAYAGAVWLGGNGFVAAFVAGLLAGPTARTLPEAVELTEIGGVLMSWVVWTAFGMLVVGPLVTAAWSWSAVVYALLSLTVVRMLPVALALHGQGLNARTIAFIGWFGPRGLASVVFLIITIEEAHLQATNPLVQATAWTIILSVVLHGLSAGPLAGAYGRIVATLPESAPEHGRHDAGNPRLRITRLGPS